MNIMFDNAGKSNADIGIVICNFNKVDYVIKCIDSVLNNKGVSYDVVVVDNASTDDSVKAISDKYSDKVTLLVNDDNLGGSGGFDTGLRYVIDKGYKYYMCVDNDIVMKEDTIKVLYDYLETHSDVGMAGSKICVMDEPERIQTHGAVLDFDRYNHRDLHSGMIDDKSLPEVQECDYVPACSVMVRAEAVAKVGIMPEENFIYYDDMTWGYNFTVGGYKVVSLRESTVYHKGGKAVNPTTFSKYYMFKNRLRFFMANVKADRREHYAETVLSELYRSVCACYIKKDRSMVKAFMYAYNDALNNITGKAKENRIIKREIYNRMREVITDEVSKVGIEFNGNYAALTNIISSINKIKKVDIYIVVSDESVFEEATKQYKEYNVIRSCDNILFDKKFRMCPHIFSAEEYDESYIYVDGWINLLIDHDDFIYASSFETNKRFFIDCNKDVLIDKMDELSR